MPDLSRPHHLPNLRRGEALDGSWLPRQRRGTTPQMIGRYPDFDVLETVDTWDDTTREVVLGRLHLGSELRFFTAEEEPTLRAFCDIALAQDRDPRVPVAEMVDRKLDTGQLDGYRYADMPEDPVTWRRVLRGLDEVAQRRYRAPSFAALDREGQEGLVGLLAAGTLDGGVWDTLNVKRAFSVCMRAMLAAFYSHPWAWNEIGFGGPAYPRGFMRLGPVAVREPFEARGATDEDPVEIPLPDS
jgi:hypothetical protein